MEIVRGNVRSKLDHDAVVVIGEVVHCAEVVDVIDTDDCRAVLEGQVLLDVLTDFEEILSGNSCIYSAGLGLGDIDAGAVCFQSRNDFLFGGFLVNGLVHQRSSMKAPLLK